MAPTWLEKRNDWTGPRYSSSVFGSLRSVDQLLLAYGPQPSFDDMAWYGLAYARSFWIANSNYNTYSPSRIYEVTQKKEFLQRSKDIFDWVIIYYLTLILSVFDIVSKWSFIFHSGKLAKQIFGKSWEFGPTSLTPPPPRTLGFRKRKKKINVYFAF